jgi:DNA-binding CsgD family transcriptional regulator
MTGESESRLLDRIYSGAWDPGALDEALRTLAQLCRSRSAGVFRLHGNALAWDQAWNMPDHFMGDFVANAAPRDPRVRFGLSHAPMTVMRDDDPALRRAMCASGIDDFTRRYDLPYTLSAVLDHPSPSGALALYVSRGADEGQPDSAQLEVFTRYAPHFARAMALRRRVRGDLLVDAVALADAGVPALGVLAMDRHRRVRWLDGGAAQLLDACEGVTLRGSRLRFDNTADQLFFGAMRPATTRHAATAADMLHIPQTDPPGTLSLRLAIHPCAPQAMHAPVLVQLRRRFVPQGHSLPEPCPQPTPRQREVLALLARGLMSKQIGSRLGIAENTVRNHIQQLLRLFDVHTRTACVARARLHNMVD